MCDGEEEKLVWWAAHPDTLPHWVALVRKLLLVQPSSAAAERVFSFLNTLSAQQEGAIIIKESSRCVISSFSLLVDPDCESVIHC